MKDKIKVFALEDEPASQQLIVDLLHKEDSEFHWATEDALERIENGDCAVALAEIQEIKPDCLIVDLVLTPKQRQMIEDEVGEEHPFTKRTIQELGGGFLLVHEALKNDILSPDRICIFTNYSQGRAAILARLSNQFYHYDIPVYAKPDADSRFLLREFVYKSKGIRVKYVYTLIGQAHDRNRERITCDLKSVSEALKIKWIPFPRMSLDNAEQWWPHDKNVVFDLAFIDLSLSPSDNEMFEKIKDEFAPRFSLDSFSSLRFAKRFKEYRKSCNVIFLSNIEKRSLVIFLLSQEVNGDWVIHRDTLTKSLVGLLIKLFIDD